MPALRSPNGRAPVRPAVRDIATLRDIAEGAAFLAAACPHMRAIHAELGDPPLRRHPAGFYGLARIVTGQQLSVASAEAIWRRVQALVEPFTPQAYLALSEGNLQQAGLSRAKRDTLRGLAEALADDRLDLEALHRASEADIHAALTALRGIGPWTADIYLMFCLGRADAWSPGDLALQYAVMDALALASRPTAAEMTEIAERWRPWRGIAARLLWSYYAARRKRAADPLT